MTTTTTTRPTNTRAPVIAPAPAPTLAAVVAAASAAVAGLGTDDPRWSEIGPLLTACVDAARRADGQPGSPIGPDETVAPVLRLRDLARLAERSHHRGHTPATAEAVRRLRSLQVTVLR